MTLSNKPLRAWAGWPTKPPAPCCMRIGRYPGMAAAPAMRGRIPPGGLPTPAHAACGLSAANVACSSIIVAEAGAY